VHKTVGTARLALGAFALAGLWTPASAAYVFINDSGGDGSLAGTYPAFEITGSNNGVGDKHVVLPADVRHGANRHVHPALRLAARLGHDV
jgi:hypothetical protein